MHEERPLILVTNDDGIASPGLRAAVEAVLPLGEVLVVAPRHQQTGTGRSIPPRGGRIYPMPIPVGGGTVQAYAVDCTPALAVMYALVEITARRPRLAVSGINYGENIGSEITSSGTIGAALEAASFGVPALAVSLATDKRYHYTHSEVVDFSTAAFFTRYFAHRLLETPLPPDVDILKVDVPAEATPRTPWRITRVSRQRYYYPLPSGQPPSVDHRPLGYEVRVDVDSLEPDSDIFALVVDQVIAVCPLSLDMTARVDLKLLEGMFMK